MVIRDRRKKTSRRFAFARVAACALSIGLALSALAGVARWTPFRVVPPALAAGQDSLVAELRARIKSRLDELRAEAGFPGATAGFALADGSAASVSTGLADVENNIPLRPTDRMLAGSIGKTYCSAVMLLAVEEGKAKLDDKIERWLARDAWFQRLPNAREITLRMLMNHSSGIPEHVLDKEFIAAMKRDPDRIWKPEELIAYVLGRKPLFPAGQGWSYADTNYILVGMIFERATGKTVYGEVERRILRPLKLQQTLPSDRRVIPGVITGYSMPNSPFGIEGRMLTGGRFPFNPQMEWTGGGFASTAEDLARWAKALYEGKVLKKSSLDQMLTGVEAREGRGSGAGNKYGLACQIRPSQWGTSYGHGGWFPGYLSEMEYFPQHGVAIAIQFNTDEGRRLKRPPRRYIAEIAKIIIGQRQ